MNERDIFLAAIELADPKERADYVDQACGGDAKLRAQVDELLKSHAETSQFLETPAAATDSAVDQTILKGSADADDDPGVEPHSGEAEFCKYLEPATRPGWLGRLGHYEIEEVLGQGAFGIVAKAFDEKLHRVVAIKLMNPDLATTSPPRKRFLREARTAAAVTHENIVAIHAVEEEPIPYLVMEYIPGKTLQQWMDENGPLEISEVLRIGRQVAAGLAAAHAVNLIHRDIKPSNILLSDGPHSKAKISDFGLARAVDDATMTSSGLIAGTPLYMSPEQARGETLDHRSDLFSLGSVLYQMVGGRPPFRAANTVAVLMRVCEDTPRPLSDVLPGTPGWLQTIIYRLLEKSRDDRYQTAQEVADLLARCQTELEQNGQVTCVEGATPAIRKSDRADKISTAIRAASNSRFPAASHATTPKKSLARKAVFILCALAALILGLFYFPVLKLQLAGKASFRNLTRDGDTRIVFLQEGKVIGEQVGFGELILPAGDYDLQITKPDQDLKIYNAILSRRHVLTPTDHVTLWTPPTRLNLAAGDRMDFMLGFTRDNPVAAPGKPLEPETTGRHDWPADAPPPAIAPFTAEQAKAHQEAWAKHLGTNVEVTNSVGAKMVLIPPGEFLMGSTDEQVAEAISLATGSIGFKGHNNWIEGAERPQHRVVLTRPFLMSATEVTIGQFQQFAKASGYRTTQEQKNASQPVPDTGQLSDTAKPPVFYRNPGHEVNDDFPAELMSWDDATAFCQWLSAQEGCVYRLPTEAEWEYACRAGTTTQFSFGDDPKQLDEYGWHRGNSSLPQQVATRRPNPFGLFDMHGNVYEFCSDFFDAKWYDRTPANNPTGPDVAGQHTIRGGWSRFAINSRSAYRSPLGANWVYQLGGFRYVKEIDLPASTTEGILEPRASAKVPPPAIAPFTAEQAKAHQEAWAKHLEIPIEYENSIGMKFRLIPPGEFMMGSTPEEIEAAIKAVNKDEAWQKRINSEGPQHKVILTQPVYVGVTEVTQSQYEQVMRTNPSYFSAEGEGKDAVANLETGNYPVEMVSWNDAAEFCVKLSQKEKLKPFYFRSGETVTPLDGTGYRLPAEAEWESACRAGTTTRFWSGDDDHGLLSAGWFGFNSDGRNHAVSELKANPFGLSDVHGNVWEWVQDSWDPAFYEKFEEDAAINPSSPFSASSQRVLRGGHRSDFPSHCSSSSRYAYTPWHRGNHLGFRVVLPVAAVKQQIDQEPAKSPQPETNGWHGWPSNAPPPAIAPFNAEQANQHQEVWAKHLGLPVEYENSIGMKFRLIPPGEFLMGSTQEEIEKISFGNQQQLEWLKQEGPQHKVILTQPVYFGLSEVTQLQYEQVMGTNPSHFSSQGEGKDAVAGLKTGNHPVEMVSWTGAAEFCAKLSQQEQLKPFYLRSGEVLSDEGNGYRLPTEAEWEFAGRAGTTTWFWCGDDVNPAGWWSFTSQKRTHAVGELSANPFGLVDVHGNVFEWVQDRLDPDFYASFEKNPAIDPFCSFYGSSDRACRGGSWGGSGFQSRSSYRHGAAVEKKANSIGFRAVLSVDAVRSRPTAPPTTTDIPQ